MRIDHVAHPCRSPEATHHFYSGLLGLQLTHAFAGEDLMLVYALPEGRSLVFTAARNPHEEDREVDWETQHLGLTVSTRAELDSWGKRLEGYGIEHRWVDDERIYFADPDGMVLELEVASAMTTDPHAIEKMQRWLAAE